MRSRAGTCSIASFAATLRRRMPSGATPRVTAKRRNSRGSSANREKSSGRTREALATRSRKASRVGRTTLQGSVIRTACPDSSPWATPSFSRHPATSARTTRICYAKDVGGASTRHQHELPAEPGSPALALRCRNRSSQASRPPPLVGRRLALGAQILLARAFFVALGN